MKDETRIARGEMFIDGEWFAHARELRCEEKCRRSKSIKCLQCEDKEECTEILRRTQEV